MSRDHPIMLFEPGAAAVPSYDARVGRWSVMVAAAGLVAVLALAGVAWLVSASGSLFPQPLPRPAEEVRVSVPAAAIAEERDRNAVALLPNSRLRPSLFLPRKYNLFLSSPASICSALGAAVGSPASNWQAAPVDGNGWECLIGPVSGSDKAWKEPDESSIFVVLRGSAADDIAQLSIKLNVLRTEDEARVLALLRHLLDTVQSFPELKLPPEAETALMARRTVTLSTSGTKFKVSSEMIDPGRVYAVAAYAAKVKFSFRAYDVSDAACCLWPNSIMGRKR